MRVLPLLVAGAAAGLVVGAACGSGHPSAPAVVAMAGQTVATPKLQTIAAGVCDAARQAPTAVDAARQTFFGTSHDQLQGRVASYARAVGPASRFILGLFNGARGPVGLGRVPFTFFSLGENSAQGTPQPGPTAPAAYLPLPGSPPPPADTSKP